MFNWDGIKFPVKLSQISLFEKNNPGYVVNVLGYSEDDGIYPVRISKQYVGEASTETQTSKTVINLMLLSGGGVSDGGETHQHYTLIKNMSRLVGMQTNKHNGKTHICLNCFNTFSLEKSFKEHTEVCLSNEAVKIEMPKKGSCIKFDKHAKKLKVPFVIYADFESYTERVTERLQQSHNTDNTQSYTEKYQKHTPSGFCYYIVYRGGIYKNPAVYAGPNVAEKFCKQLEMETRDIYDKYFKNEVSMKITRAELNEWKRTNVCHICEEDICDDVTPKVKDHCHLTGEYRGAAHQECNLKYKEPSFIPVIFHNLSGYDAHLFIKQLGAVSSGEINCIANTEEKYISFTKKILVETVSGKTVLKKRDSVVSGKTVWK